MRRQLLVGVLFLLFSTNIFAQCIKGNCQNGYGTYSYKSGAIYKGDFRNGRIDGQGVLYFSNGDRYIGEWENQRREGRGKMVFIKGNTYQGNFVSNQFQGHGVMEYANGGEYDGNWKNGQYNGEGIYVFQNGNQYEGEFLNGQFHGNGNMAYANGGKYIGEWRNNKRHGDGKLTPVNGQITEGTWINDEFQELPNTNTLATYASPEISDKNLRNCNTTYCDNSKGFYSYPDGSKFIGAFKNGKPEGQGICYYYNGDKYVGQWKNHSPHGEGVYTYKNKKTVAAIWSYGKPMRQLDIIKEDELANSINVDKNSEVKIWSVVVGVSTYEHMPALRFTDDDAYRFYAFLKSPEGGALANEQIKVLIDEDATRNNIISALKETLLKADENDVIVFYYSGHGLEGSFIPVDYDGFNNRLMHDEIKMIFEKSKAKHKMIFADACYSGSLLAMKSPFHQTMKKYYESFENTRGGLAFFTSSHGEEISLEDGGLRQGIFTHFLIRGLNGEADINHNKIVTMKELYDFVAKKVRHYTAKVQTPVVTGNYDNNMPVAMIR